MPLSQTPAHKSDPTFLSRIDSTFRSTGLRARTVESAKWFIESLKNIRNINRRALLKDDRLAQRNRTLIGRMYMFVYDAKHKETLPFYDRFPLILMVGPAPDGFYGLNLHYLPPRLRALFFDKLMVITNNDKFDDSTKLKLSYDLLSSSAKFKAFAPCFKHYLFAHMKTKPVHVPATDWELVLFLPTEQFVGAKKTQVWAKSKILLQESV